VPEPIGEGLGRFLRRVRICKNNKGNRTKGLSTAPFCYLDAIFDINRN